MIESVIIALIPQAALLTKLQQEEFTTKSAEALAPLVKSTGMAIDDERVARPARRSEGWPSVCRWCWSEPYSNVRWQAPRTRNMW